MRKEEKKRKKIESKKDIAKKHEHRGGKQRKPREKNEEKVKLKGGLNSDHYKVYKLSLKNDVEEVRKVKRKMEKKRKNGECSCCCLVV